MTEEEFGEYTTTGPAAQMVCKSPGTLANDRLHRRGLPYVKFGGRVLYKIEDIRKYLEARKVYPAGR